MKKNTQKIISIALVAVLLATTTAILFNPATDADKEQFTFAAPYMLPNTYDEAALIDYNNLLATIDPDILEQIGIDPAFMAITPAVGVVATVILIVLAYSIGYVSGYLAGLNAAPGIIQEEVNAVMRQLEAEKVSWYGDGAISMATSILPMTTTMWGFTQDHWNRAVELAVSDGWVYGQEYDPNYILEQSQMRVNIEAVVYNWQAAIDNAFTQMLTNINAFNDYGYSSSITTNLAWDTGSAELRDSIIDFATLVSDTTSGQTVYIDTSTVVEGGIYHQETSGTLYNLTNANVVLRDIWTGSNTTAGLTVTLLPGASDASLLVYDGSSTFIQSGLYRIETAGATIAGPLSKAADENAADVFGTMIHSSDVIRWFTWSNDTTYVNQVGSHFLPSTTENLSMKLGYVDKDSINQTATVDIVGSKTLSDGVSTQYINLIRDWQNQIDRMNITIDIAARSGQVMWTIFDVCQTSIPFLSPSSIITYIPGVTLNANQAAMIALEQMMQIARIYDQFGDKLHDGLTINFTPDSLDLYILGDIYLNNIPMYSNVVFTPFSMLSENTFTTGKFTDWNNAGFIQIWGTSDDISTWGGPDGTSMYGLVPLSNGYSIDVKQIGRSGALTDTVTLTPEQIRKYTTEPGVPPGPLPPIVIEDPADLIAILIMAFGALIFLIGIFTRSAPVLLLGLLILAVGALIYFVVPAIMGWLGGLWPFSFGSGVLP